MITGASSGIGRATALQIAQHGGVPILVARRADALEELRKEIERAGGQAWVYACDITEEESVDTLVKQLLTDHEGIDMLVNNAGRSIRRSIKLSYDRFHDFERTMALNYFGAVRLILGLLPHMTERRFGHIVNVSSIGVQTNPPRFSRVRRVEGRARRVQPRGGHRDVRRRRDVHEHPHAAGAHADDRPDVALRRLPHEDARRKPRTCSIDALVNRPKTIDTRLGTFGEVLHAVAPKLADEVLHVAYRVFPDSAAAKGRRPRRARCRRSPVRPTPSPASCPACTGSRASATLDAGADRNRHARPSPPREHAPMTDATDLAADLALARSLAAAADATARREHAAGRPDRDEGRRHAGDERRPRGRPGARRRAARGAGRRTRSSARSPGSMVTSGRRWILDPIDGTFNLVAGHAHWGTHVALEVDGVVVVGVITRPMLGAHWWATLGGGAFADRRCRSDAVAGVATLGRRRGRAPTVERRTPTTRPRSAPRRRGPTPT